MVHSEQVHFVCTLTNVHDVVPLVIKDEPVEEKGQFGIRRCSIGLKGQHQGNSHQQTNE